MCRQSHLDPLTVLSVEVGVVEVSVQGIGCGRGYRDHDVQCRDALRDVQCGDASCDVLCRDAL